MSRIDRINQTMKREISLIVHSEVKDPRLEFVSITQVEVSRDLQHARVFFSVLGDQSQAGKAEDGLNSAKGFIRKLVGQRIRMRFTPEIEFIYDRSIEYSARIEQTLEEIRHESEGDSPSD